jgi:hypothetical protein
MADKESKATPAEATPENVVEAPVKKRSIDLTKFNTLAVVSLATAVTGFGAVAGVITGHVALSQLKRTDERGRGLAIAGVIIGYASLGFFVVASIAGAVLRLRGIHIGDGMGQGHFGQGQGQFGPDDQMNGFGHMQGGHDMDDKGMGHGGMNGGPGQLPQVDGGQRPPMDGGVMPNPTDMPLPAPATN